MQSRRHRSLGEVALSWIFRATYPGGEHGLVLVHSLCLSFSLTFFFSSSFLFFLLFSSSLPFLPFSSREIVLSCRLAGWQQPDSRSQDYMLLCTISRSPDLHVPVRAMFLSPIGRVCAAMREERGGANVLKRRFSLGYTTGARPNGRDKTPGDLSHQQSKSRRDLIKDTSRHG
jgi:hypothetical protein